MAFDFPTPTFIGQQFTPTGGPTFSWNGQAWDLAASASVLATGLVPIQVKVVTAGQANVDFTGIDATYDEYEIHWHNVRHTADGNSLCFRISSDNGASFKNAANYYTANSYVVPTSANSLAGSGITLATQGQFGWAIYGAAQYIGEMKFYRPWDGAMYKYIMHRGVAPGSAEHYYYDGYNAFFGDTAIINAIRLFPFSTTFAQGTFILYGRPKGPVVPVVPIGSRVLVDQKVLPPASQFVTFLQGLDGTYDDMELTFSGVSVDVNGSLGFQITQDGGASWKTGAGDYNYQLAFYSNPSGAGAFTAGTIAFGALGGHNAGVASAHGTIRFFAPASDYSKVFFINTFVCTTTLQGYAGPVIFLSSALPFNGIRICNNAGTNALTAGTFKLYGTKK